MDYKYTGIIIAKRDVGETDRLYTIYTLENGKIQALAKGARKLQAKLAGNLENFTLADISIVKNQGTGKITSSIVENNFSLVKNNPEALSAAFRGAETFNRLVDMENKDESVFALLLEYLEALESNHNLSQEKAEIMRLGFIFRLLEKLGYGLEVSQCVICQNPLSAKEENYFSAEQGGIICLNCCKNNTQVMKINNNSIKVIRVFFQNRIKPLTKLKIEPKDLRELQLIAGRFVEWIRG